MKLSEWAKQNNISYNTAYKWFKSNQLPTNVEASITPTGTIFIIEKGNMQETKLPIDQNQINLFKKGHYFTEFMKNMVDNFPEFELANIAAKNMKPNQIKNEYIKSNYKIKDFHERNIKHPNEIIGVGEFNKNPKILNKSNEYIIIASIPGFNQNEISIKSIKNNQEFTILVETNHVIKDEEDFSPTNFSYELSLLKTQDIISNVSYVNGILTISIPKLKDEPKPLEPITNEWNWNKP